MVEALTRMYADDLYDEDEVIAAARLKASDYAITCVSPATGAFLRYLVHVTGAKAIVEVGTGTGVSGLYLASRQDVTLTSIDVESEAQHAAREFFTRAGIRQGRSRLINGRSADLLPRLAASSYDLVVLDGDPIETPGDAKEALRMLRPGGSLVILRALMGGKVADPARREDDVVAARGLVRDLMASEDLEVSVLPFGDGVVLATAR